MFRREVLSLGMSASRVGERRNETVPGVVSYCFPYVDASSGPAVG